MSVVFDGFKPLRLTTGSPKRRPQKLHKTSFDCKKCILFDAIFFSTWGPFSSRRTGPPSLGSFAHRYRSCSAVGSFAGGPSKGAPRGPPKPTKTRFTCKKCRFLHNYFATTLSQPAARRGPSWNTPGPKRGGPRKPPEPTKMTRTRPNTTDISFFTKTRRKLRFKKYARRRGETPNLTFQGTPTEG